MSLRIEGLDYPVRGIFGGYRGQFSTVPYYLKVQEYRDIENRDIWEYRLNFNEQQIRRLLMHAWELGHASFDYFFFKENCSYHLLSLLEYADPSLHLTERFRFWTVPADTVRVLAAEPGLVRDDRVPSIPRDAHSSQTRTPVGHGTGVGETTGARWVDH
jgi:hypothetical protein